MYKFKQDDIVRYDCGVLNGKGKVVGIAVAEQAVIGATVIIQDMSHNFPNETYPYTHVAMNVF